MLRSAEEILLFLLDEQSGALPLHPRTAALVLAGAVLMDLQLADRIDTDLDTLTLSDPDPLGDDLLDPTLVDIASSGETRDAAFWVDRTATERGGEIRERAIARLVERGILADPDDSGFLTLTALVSRSRRYPLADGTVRDDVQLRVMGVLFSNDIPDPADVVIISLANACGAFERILSPPEFRKLRRRFTNASKVFRRVLSPSDFEKVQSRVDLFSRLDLIGQAVAGLGRVAAVAEPGGDAPCVKPPMARGLPLFGSALDITRDARTFWVKRYLELGPVFRLRLLSRRMTVLAGPDANLFMTHRERYHLSTGDLWEDFRKELGASRFLLGMDGPDHHRMRRELRNGFSRGLVERHIPELVEIVRKRTATWPLDAPQPGFATLQHIVADQLGRIAAGAVTGDYADDAIFVFRKLVLTRVIRSHPVLWRRGRFRRSLDRLRRLCRTVLAEHRLRRPSGDLIDDLIRLHQTDPAFLPETDLTISALMPFIAGIDTAASTMAYMLYVLLTQPDLRERMRAEADELFAGGMPTVEGLDALDVTRRIAMETMRMYPVVGALRRSVATSFHFGGYRIPAGEELLIAISVPHHLPECFPDPERFDIDRYLPGREEHKRPGAYAPFGLGAHRCLGANLTGPQIALTLATLLHDNELELDPPDYRVKTVVAPFQSPDAGFRFKVTARRGEALRHDDRPA